MIGKRSVFQWKNIRIAELVSMMVLVVNDNAHIRFSIKKKYDLYIVFLRPTHPTTSCIPAVRQRHE